MPAGFYANFLKPAADRIVGITGSVITLPLIGVLALLVRAESKGNPIYAQRRVGKNCKTFLMFKLRTMIKNADKGSFQTAKGDPRITRMGAFLRKTSLDELPQFWNLALGQMSLIGPRPDMPAQETIYPREGFWKLRHRVKPGITGLAQANGRSECTFEDRMDLDGHYVENLSLGMDARILLKTIQIVTLKKGTN